MGCGGSLANVMFFVGALDVTDVTFDLVCELCVYVVCVLRLIIWCRLTSPGLASPRLIGSGFGDVIVE